MTKTLQLNHSKTMPKIRKFITLRLGMFILIMLVWVLGHNARCRINRFNLTHDTRHINKHISGTDDAKKVNRRDSIHVA